MTALPIRFYFNSLVITLLLAGCKPSATPDSQDTHEDSPYAGFESLPSSKTKIKNSNDLPETQTTNHLIWDSYYHGGGVSVGDVNQDGLPDLYFTNTMKENALYLNKGNMVFEDVTVKAGVGAGAGINWGSTMADINGDGWLDIYVCKTGWTNEKDIKRNKCFINQKDGTFKEMSKSMGIDNPGFSLQAAFFDYDLDNDLDLFIMNQPNNNRAERQKYVNADEKLFMDESTSDRLYRNDGNMHFTDVSKEANVESFTYGLGLKICDLNGDHLPDVYVASDYEWPDQLLINNGDGTFTNKVHEYLNHLTYFSMGIDVGDINNDAMDDIFVLDMAGVNHLRSKTNMPSMNAEKFWKLVAKGNHHQYMYNVLQLNQGKGMFSDISFEAGVSKTDWSWSVLMMDADNDGFQDIYVTNGIKRDITNNDFANKFKDMIEHNSVPEDLTKLIDMMPSTPMANFMFHNEGKLHFSNKADQWGLAQLSFSNGCAYSDLDHDGDLDLIVNNVDSEAFVYKNKANESGQHYIQFHLTSPKSGRPVEGSRVTLYADGKILQSQYFHPVHGFMSSSEPLIHFGLAATTKIDSAVIIWPDQNIYVISNPEVNKRHEIDQDNIVKTRKFVPAHKQAQWLTDQSAVISPAFVHKENEYDDYKHQVLLPYKMSTSGPALAVADVNGDGLEDYFIGGAAGQSSVLYLQNAKGGFVAAPAQPWSANAVCDAMGALFFDADGDQDNDLYIATGGSEFLTGDPNYKDLLFINDGKGKFTLSTGLPVMNTSSKAVAAGDWDKDGDLDLFVGSRNMPRKYPYADRYYFLKNDGGKFTDVTKSISADQQMNMITDAEFADKDKDGDLDLLICGDWFAPTWLMNDAGKFTRADLPGIQTHAGWWNTVTVVDLNGDGNLDILAGNAGVNNKFKASKEEPFLVLASDFDLNGASDIVLATHFDGKEVPVRGRECSSQQLPYIAKEFPTYDGFAKASLQDIIGKERLKGSLRLEMTEFKSGIFWGQADGDYTFEAFPVYAQLSPIVDFVIEDADGDGKNEIIAAGNLYDTEVETTRYDAGLGVIMDWSDGKWTAYTPAETGFYANGNVRAMRAIKVNGKNSVLLARGNDKMSLLEFSR